MTFFDFDLLVNADWDEIVFSGCKSMEKRRVKAQCQKQAFHAFAKS